MSGTESLEELLAPHSEKEYGKMPKKRLVDCCNARNNLNGIGKLDASGKISALARRLREYDTGRRKAEARAKAATTSKPAGGKIDQENRIEDGGAEPGEGGAGDGDNVEGGQVNLEEDQVNPEEDQVDLLENRADTREGLRTSPLQPHDIPSIFAFEDDITDIYYYDDHGFRRAIPSHEEALETAAQKAANLGYKRYIDQIDIVNIKYRDTKKRSENSTTPQKNPKEKPRKSLVWIVIDTQEFRTLYTDHLHVEEKEENIADFQVQGPIKLPRPEESTRLNKKTLMKCSTLAEEFFTYNPGENELHLPVRYPRVHSDGFG